MSVAYELSSPARGRGVVSALRRSFATVEGPRTSERENWLDTFDWRLWRAGTALTGRRQGDGWLVRWVDSRSGIEFADRFDSPPAFAWDLPPGRFRRELEAVIEMRRLLPRVEVERTGREECVLDRREKTVARLRFETVRVRRAGAGKLVGLPKRIVATPVRGFDREFARLLALLDGQGLERQSRPLVDLAYEACGSTPGDYVSKVQVPLEPGLPAHLAMRRIHRQLLETIRRNEEGLRQDLDSEFLHDFRVAVRRTRSALSQVKGVLPVDRVRRFRSEFSWLGGKTGRLRDLDVYLLKLDDYRTSLPAAADLGALEELLRRKQKNEHRRVVRALGTRRYRRLLADWEEFLAEEETPDTPPEGFDPIARVARDRILKAHARVIEKGRAIGPDSPGEKLHRLRIDCKKLRYLLEFFRDLYDPKRIGSVIRALKGLQENLGDFNDLTVQRGAMTRFAGELAEVHAPAEPLLALGQLISSLSARHGEERRRFHRQFERFDRPRIRKRLRRLVESAVP